ncbi:MAG: phosphoribosylformylglycinamidine synthase I [Methermicoccaceae archaeon]
MKVAVVSFGGTNCDRDVVKVLEEMGVLAELVWYKEESRLYDYDAIVMPGGFSYGDYLRAGAIAARTPLLDKVRDMADSGTPVLGICNGFQMLTESKMLEGALLVNDYPKFLCTWCYLRVETTRSPFTSLFDKGEVIRIPIAHREGRYFHNNPKELWDKKCIALRYSDEMGDVRDEVNPNGSVDGIAGVLNDAGNVMGLMPHPERAYSFLLGSEDGRRMLEGMCESIR